MQNNLNNLSLKQLRAMDEVALRGSFIEAAKALHFTPSAMSETIKSLEEHVGLRLFHRSTRHVSLTVAGEAFLESVRSALALIETALGEMADLKHLRAGRVRVMGATSALSCLVAPCLAELFRHATSLKVEMRTGLSETMLRALQDGSVDFCVASVPPNAPDDIEHWPLLEDQFGLVGHRNHPALQTDHASLSDAQNFPFVALTNRSMINDLLEADPATPASFMHPSITVDATGSMAAVLEQGIAVGILPALALHQMGRPDLRFVPLKPPFPVRCVELSRRAGRSLSPAAQALWDLIGKHAAALTGLPGIQLIAKET